MASRGIELPDADAVSRKMVHRIIMPPKAQSLTPKAQKQTYRITRDKRGEPSCRLAHILAPNVDSAECEITRLKHHNRVPMTCSILNGEPGHLVHVFRVYCFEIDSV